MGKQNERKSKVTYSVRIDPDLIRLLRHVAVEENRSVGGLLEEGINAVLKKRKLSENTFFKSISRQNMKAWTLMMTDSISPDF